MVSVSAGWQCGFPGQGEGREWNWREGGNSGRHCLPNPVPERLTQASLVLYPLNSRRRSEMTHCQLRSLTWD